MEAMYESAKAEAAAAQENFDRATTAARRNWEWDTHMGMTNAPFEEWVAMNAPQYNAAKAQRDIAAAKEKSLSSAMGRS